MPVTDRSSERPRVQIPLGSDHHGLSIDGTMVYAYNRDFKHPGDEALSTLPDPVLPERANEAYWNHYEADNNGWVSQCQDCGYLSMSKNTRTTAMNKHECTNCGGTSWRRVYPRDSLKTVPDEHKDEVFVDVLELTPDDVPNHRSHLGRIQSQLEDYVSKDELLDIVADAVADAREQGYVDY